MNYRTEIEGLRAIAVTSIILSHLGFLANSIINDFKSLISDIKK
jgi:peptidoglycan/LPS O-acetylase OafA/YrhL